MAQPTDGNFKAIKESMIDCCRFDIQVPLAEFRSEFENRVIPLELGEESTNSARRGWERHTILKKERSGSVGGCDFMDGRTIDDFPVLKQFIAKNFSDSSLVSAKYAIVPPGGVIGLHQDGHSKNNPSLNKFVSETIRIHVPIYTSEKAMLYVGPKYQHMAEGEVWMLNNFAFHGVINADPTVRRNHLILDFNPGEKLIEQISEKRAAEGIVNFSMLKTLINNSASGKARKFTKTLSWYSKIRLRFSKSDDISAIAN